MSMAKSMPEMEEECRFSPKVAGVVVCTIAALGAVVSLPDAPQKSKVASALGVAALTAWLARYMGRQGHKNTAKKDPKKIQSKETLGHLAALAERGAAQSHVERRCQRENEPWPAEDGVRGDEPTPDPGVRENEPTPVYSSLKRVGRDSAAMDHTTWGTDDRRLGWTGNGGTTARTFGGRVQKLTNDSRNSAQCCVQPVVLLPWLVKSSDLQRCGFREMRWASILALE